MKVSKRILATGLVWGLGGMALTAPADEIDEILKLERLADEGFLSGGADMPPARAPRVQAAATPAPRPAPAPTPTLRGDAGGVDRELALAQAEIARLNQALADQAARHARELQRYHYNMGCVYKAAREFTRAETEFQRALALNPDDAATHYNLGILYEVDLKQPRKAIAHYERFLELAPNDRDARQVRTWLVALHP